MQYAKGWSIDTARAQRGRPEAPPHPRVAKVRVSGGPSPPAGRPPTPTAAEGGLTRTHEPARRPARCGRGAGRPPAGGRSACAGWRRRPAAPRGRGPAYPPPSPPSLTPSPATRRGRRPRRVGKAGGGRGGRECKGLMRPPPSPPGERKGLQAGQDVRRPTASSPQQSARSGHRRRTRHRLNPN